MSSLAERLLRALVAVSLSLAAAHGHCECAEGRDDVLPSWKSWGGDLLNSRSAPPSHSSRLSSSGAFRRVAFYNASAAVTASPTTTGDLLVYFTTASGLVVAANRFTGGEVWRFDVAAFLAGRGVKDDGVTPAASRNSPALTAGFLFVGTLRGAYLVKLNRFTGRLVWATRVSEHPFAIVSASPRVYDGRVYVGVSSLEELAALVVPGYKLSFVGSFSAVDAVSGAVVWTFRTLPEGYTGGAIWGSEPPIDAARNQVVVSTGNPYSLPADVEACRVRTSTAPATFPDPCRAAGDFSESVVALDLADGSVRWRFTQSPVEAWTLACGLGQPGSPNYVPRNPESCPQTPGPDIDFAQSPVLVRGAPGRTPHGRDTLYVGQKNGVVWAVDAETGALRWSTSTGNGGALGGVMFGCSTDGRRLFYSQTNSEGQPYKLADGRTTTSGHAGGLSLLDGSVEWQTPLACTLTPPLTHAHGAVFVPCGQLSEGPPGGQLHVLSAEGGEALFRLLGTPGAYAQGVSVVGDRAYIPLGATLYSQIVSDGGVLIMELQP